MKGPVKAYNNPNFLNSHDARTIRILCEYIETEKRLAAHNVLHTAVFFGSARTKPDKKSKNSAHYWAAEELAFRLAQWSKELKKENEYKGFYICTGGGPGIMEAANRGAHRAREKSIGLNISLPFEQQPNKYITPELSFEFHYFFIRKLWFLYHAKAVIVFPGGFGTMDELFETLTLVQTQKLAKRNIPILLYDREWWHSVFHIDRLLESDMIEPKDLKLLHFFSSPEEGFSILKPKIGRLIDQVTNRIEH